MTTSKVKRIEEIKEWAGQKGTVYYHNLEMENGDKINIGKQKQLSVGDELTYEITEHGQQEYQKAKSVNPNNGFKGRQVDEDAILFQVSLKEATNIIGFDGWGNKTELSEKMDYLTDMALAIAIRSKERIATLKKN